VISDELLQKNELILNPNTLWVEVCSWCWRTGSILLWSRFLPSVPCAFTCYAWVIQNGYATYFMSKMHFDMQGIIILRNRKIYDVNFETFNACSYKFSPWKAMFFCCILFWLLPSHLSLPLKPPPPKKEK
jgi:hypothetical protein